MYCFWRRWRRSAEWRCFIRTKTGEKLALFAGIDNAKFRRPVVPGDQVRMVAEVTRLKGSIGKVFGQAFVDDQLAAEGEFLFCFGAKKRVIRLI